MWESTQGSLCPSHMKIHSSMQIQWPFFTKTWAKGHWPLDDLWPQICWGHMCDSTQGSLCPLSHENISKYVDTVTLFSKTWTKDHWPLDLWPHICSGHMCDSTQGSFCPSPMGIHQCMWIEWSILQNTTYYIHTTYYIIHTTYRMSDHTVFLNTVQVRHKKKKKKKKKKKFTLTNKILSDFHCTLYKRTHHQTIGGPPWECYACCRDSQSDVRHHHHQSWLWRSCHIAWIGWNAILHCLFGIGQDGLWFCRHQDSIFPLVYHRQAVRCKKNCTLQLSIGLIKG